LRRLYRRRAANGSEVARNAIRRKKDSSITNPQQMFALAKVTFEADAFGNLKGRDDGSFDLLKRLEICV
jgi:hypothetical protein